jgi:acyl dehydratase
MTQLDDIAARFSGLVGGEAVPVTRVVSDADIERLARAIGSTNARYWDRELARRSPWGGIVAPPTFLATIRAAAPIDGNLGLPVLNGGNRFTYARPVRPGDVVTGAAAVSDVRMKEGSAGRMLFLVKRTTFVNQHNERVGSVEHTRIVRETR